MNTGKKRLVFVLISIFLALVFVHLSNATSAQCNSASGMTCNGYYGCIESSGYCWADSGTSCNTKCSISCVGGQCGGIGASCVSNIDCEYCVKEQFNCDPDDYCQNGACYDAPECTACENQVGNNCKCPSYCGGNVGLANRDCFGPQTCTTCDNTEANCLCKPECTNAGQNGQCGGYNCISGCNIDPVNCAGNPGPGGTTCCEEATKATDCAVSGKSGSCFSCSAPTSVNPNQCQVILNNICGPEKCSDSTGGDNKYGTGNKLVSSFGLCDSSGFCDASSTIPVCVQYHGTNPWGPSVCVDGTAGCPNTCATCGDPACDDLPMNTDGDLCSSSENTNYLCRDNSDNDGDGLIDKNDPQCNRDGEPCVTGYGCPSHYSKSYCIDTDSDKIIDTCSPCSSSPPSYARCGTMASNGSDSGVCTRLSAPDDFYISAIATPSVLRPSDKMYFSKCGSEQLCRGSAIYPSGGDCGKLQLDDDKFKVVLSDSGGDGFDDIVPISRSLKLDVTIGLPSSENFAWSYSSFCKTLNNMNSAKSDRYCGDIRQVFTPGTSDEDVNNLVIGNSPLLTNLQKTGTVSAEIPLDCDSALVGNSFNVGRIEIGSSSQPYASTGGFAVASRDESFVWQATNSAVDIVECETNADCVSCFHENRPICDTSNNRCVARPNEKNCYIDPNNCLCASGPDPQKSRNLLSNPSFELTWKDVEQ